MLKTRNLEYFSQIVNVFDSQQSKQFEIVALMAVWGEFGRDKNL